MELSSNENYKYLFTETVIKEIVDEIIELGIVAYQKKHSKGVR